MHRQRNRRLPIWIATCVALLGSGACDQGTKPGSLVGSYAVHGVLIENSCGQTALPTSNPLDFVVEIRTISSVAYWMPGKAAQNSGTLNDSGNFQFTMSETQVVQTAASTGQLEPSDFLSAEPDFDLQKKQARACALTRKQTVKGKLARRIEDGGVSETPSASQRDAATALEADATAVDSNDDLSAEHVIEVTPTSGSDCNGALAALGGVFLTLPCEARYVLSGSLDTSVATLGAVDSGEETP